MLWIREEEVFPRSDYVTPPQRCREYDLDGICGDVRIEDPKAAPPLFCRNFCMVMRLAMAGLPLD